MASNVAQVCQEGNQIGHITNNERCKSSCYCPDRQKKWQALLRAICTV